MNIQVYQSFLTVVQCRSFTQAAKYLNFTQPTISNHINALEEEYGVILFTRDGKNVYLTQAGKNFVPIAQQLMADYQKSQEVMRQFQKKNYSLKIGVSTQGINFYLLPVLLKLKKEFPELDIEVNRCMTVESTINATRGLVQSITREDLHFPRNLKCTKIFLTKMPKFDLRPTTTHFLRTVLNILSRAVTKSSTKHTTCTTAMLQTILKPSTKKCFLPRV